MIDDELVHIIKHISAQSQIEQRPWVYGHISSYDPNTHTARVIVPSMRDDQTDAPLHSGWLPMGTSQVSGQVGLQIVPFGGASADKPTAGEMCLVAINERGTGVAAIVATFYTAAQRPPNTVLPQEQQLKPGELIIRHSSGTIARFHSNGDFEVTTGGDGAVNVAVSGKGGINLTATGQGSIVVNSAQEIDVTAPSLKVTGDLHVTGSVTEGFGTGSTFRLGTHHHQPDSHGDTVPGPVPNT
jgi:hypothetical protein